MDARAFERRNTLDSKPGVRDCLGLPNREEEKCDAFRAKRNSTPLGDVGLCLPSTLDTAVASPAAASANPAPSVSAAATAELPG
jgi:hypothetical protein